MKISAEKINNDEKVGRLGPAFDAASATHPASVPVVTSNRYARSRFFATILQAVPIPETHPTRPTSLYGWSKLMRHPPTG